MKLFQTTGLDFVYFLLLFYPKPLHNQSIELFCELNIVIRLIWNLFSETGEGLYLPLLYLGIQKWYSNMALDSSYTIHLRKNDYFQ